MSLRTPNGESLSAIFYAEKKRMAWIEKLYNNVRTKLNRLGDIVTLAPSSLRPRNDRGIALYWTGNADDRRRVEKVLGCTIDEQDEAIVKFGRMKVRVKFLSRPGIVAGMGQRRPRRRAA